MHMLSADPNTQKNVKICYFYQFFHVIQKKKLKFFENEINRTKCSIEMITSRNNLFFFSMMDNEQNIPSRYIMSCSLFFYAAIPIDAYIVCIGNRIWRTFSVGCRGNCECIRWIIAQCYRFNLCFQAIRKPIKSHLCLHFFPSQISILSSVWAAFKIVSNRLKSDVVPDKFEIVNHYVYNNQQNWA